LIKKSKKKKKKEKRTDDENGEKTSNKDVIVTEIVDAGLFYVQIPSESTQLEELMKNLKEEKFDSAAKHTPSVNELVAAKFTEDDTWYRAFVKADKSDNKFLVFYIDYGNSEILSGDRIRQLPKKYQDLEPQAYEASLAYIKPPIGNEEFADEAAYSLKEMVWNKTMFANIEYRDKNHLFLGLGDRDSQIHVNAALLRSGLARVEKSKKKADKHDKGLIDKLKDEEQQARSQHLNLWRYGDAGSDDEDERPKQKDKKGAPKAKTPATKPAEKKNEGKEEKK